MQLLKITTVPIKYREQENIPADNSNSVFSLDSVEKNSENIQIPVANTSNSRNNPEMYDESLVNGSVPVVQRKADSMVHESSSESAGNNYNVNYRYGRKNIQPEPKQDVSAFRRNNVHTAATIDSALDSIESLIPDKSWEPETNHHNNQVTEPEPRKVVEEFAHVEIEYLGGFNYVPASSAPDYEEPEE